MFKRDYLRSLRSKVVCGAGGGREGVKKCKQKIHDQLDCYSMVTCAQSAADSDSPSRVRILDPP